MEKKMASKSSLDPYWNQPLDQLYAQTHSSPQGISDDEAKERMQIFGSNSISKKRKKSAFYFFIIQFKSPLVLILLFAVVISLFLQEWIDALIITVIVLGSAIMTFIQEYSSSNAIEKMQAQVKIKCVVMRDGAERVIFAEDVVPGDVIKLSAGSLIPADGVLIEGDDFFVNQAVLTGETFPVEKTPGIVAAGAGIAERTNCVYMGTSVSSGYGKALIINTGSKTIFGGIAANLEGRPAETSFEQGIRKFGNLLSQIMLIMAVAVFAIKVLLQQDLVDSLLFAIALAVGMSPELLPAIISITLAKGAQLMAKQGVIVRRLNSLENFGSMDVLCTDKTGTITKGVVLLDKAVDHDGKDDLETLRYAALNSFNQTGLNNPLDAAIIEGTNKACLDLSSYEKGRRFRLTSNENGCRSSFRKAMMPPCSLRKAHLIPSWQFARKSRPVMVSFS